jgi:predicted ATP-grasp superfamily ATP-dependent carboligase
LNSKTILILDGEQRSSLAATRSLGKKNLNVVVGSVLSTSLAGMSRYTTETVQYADPYLFPAEFINDIISTIKTHKVDILFPMTDITVYTILSHIGKLSPLVQIPLVTYDQYQKASNKIGLMRMAEQLSVPIPKTIYIDTPESIDRERILSTISPPFVMKPQASLILHEHQIRHVGVVIVNNKMEFINALDKSIAFRYPFMIQEKIDGPGLGIFALCRKGAPLAIFSHRRIREKPPWGGVSVLSESTEPDPDAKEYALKLLNELEWNGVAMVEFKQDHKRGLPVLLEINARFWGSLQLAIDSGVDFPYLLYLQSQGASDLPHIEYKHSRLRWLLGDIDNLYITLKSRKTKLPYNSQDKLRAIIDFLKEFTMGSRFEVLRRDDLRPFYWELGRYIKTIFRRSCDKKWTR